MSKNSKQIKDIAQKIAKLKKESIHRLNLLAGKQDDIIKNFIIKLEQKKTKQVKEKL